MAKSKKRKLFLVISLIVVGALVLTLIGLIIFLPVTYNYDKTLVSNVGKDNITLVENDDYVTLKNTTGDSFNVISFTDLHLDTYKNNGATDTLNLMIRNIVNEEPDLIVFGGDIITSSFNLRRAKQFCEVLEDLGVYWTLTLGNHEHDNIWSITREKMLKVFKRYSHCLIDNTTKYTSDGKEVWGNGNHVINLLDQNNNIIQSIYLLDGGQDLSSDDLETYKEENNSRVLDGDIQEYDYDYVKDTQIQWFVETQEKIKSLNNNVSPKSTLFCHIPLYTFETAWTSITDETRYFNNIYHDVEYTMECESGIINVSSASNNALLYGERRECVNCAPIEATYNNKTLFDYCKDYNTQAVFAGHDHVNDFIVKYEGIILGYIKTGGYTQYNTYSKKKINGDDIEDHLIHGYTMLKFEGSGNLIIETKNNCDQDYYSEIKTEIESRLKKGAKK